ncbi:MAG: glycosyltransferase family 4 protein [Candidatus Omnitrophica bacterium]|nr:glycosyltransferase family 4 protein [Candidatus Omnitrophota bacterium]MCM8816108.1 glycosyltransferase family 4 protein [Candidatus Omnitrophota bacterium]
MKQKKIGIDAHAIGLKQGGNERYIEGLLKGLSEIETCGLSFTIFFNHKAKIPDFLKGNKSFEIERVSVNPIKRLFFDLPKNAKKSKLDLLHTQYHLPPHIGIPSVITLHDVSYFTHPEFFPIYERLKMNLMMPLSIKKAKKIITVSEFSKKEILNIYNVKRDKICVIYNGISNKFKPAGQKEIKETLAKYGIRQPYILTVSNLQPRKNLKGVIESFTKVLEKNENFPCNLVIVGKKLWLYDEIFSKIRNSRFNSRIILTGYIDDKDLVSLYSGAKVFIYISFYEGFGFPPLEAMACGCVVITSNTSSLPEVTGDTAIHVNPENYEEIASNIIKICHDTNLQNTLREKGLMLVKKFTWHECAMKTIQVYKNVLSLI